MKKLGGKDNKMAIGKPRITLEEGLAIGALLVVGLYVFSIVFGKMLGFDFVPGTSALFFLVVTSALVAFAITMKMMRGYVIGSKDIIILVIIVGLTVATLIYLPDLAPDLFEGSVLSLRQGLGLP